jgi:hypothetical protein
MDHPDHPVIYLADRVIQTRVIQTRVIQTRVIQTS